MVLLYVVIIYCLSVWFQAVVVVKYLFQFGFFSWNSRADTNDPSWPPKIIGIEQKDNFAVMDLILLLALFIHRTILKVRLPLVCLTYHLTAVADAF